MANINKKSTVSKATGLPSKEQMLTAPQNSDTIPAVINQQNGQQAPAKLTEGEFVFSLPAIIALGEGDYDTGASLLEQMHQELKSVGEQMLGQGGEQGLGTVPME